MQDLQKWQEARQETDDKREMSRQRDGMWPYFPAGELARVGHVRRFWAGESNASVVVRLPHHVAPPDGMKLAIAKFRETYPDHPLSGPWSRFKDF